MVAGFFLLFFVNMRFSQSIFYDFPGNGALSESIFCALPGVLRL